MEVPGLFSDFEAGTLRVDPQHIVFKDVNDAKTPRTTKLKPLSHIELTIVKQWIETALK